MKKLPYLITFLLFVSCSESIIQNNNATIKFNKTTHDFKQINFNEKAEYSFAFSNSSKTTLIISNVVTTCGCTVPEWTKQPIMPDKKGEIKIKYDTSRPGSFSKTIIVYYNGKDSPAKLSINGSVNYTNEN